MDAEVRSVADGEMSLVPVAVTLNSSCLAFIWASPAWLWIDERAKARRGGFRRSSPGSVYPTLQMLEEAVIWPVKSRWQACLYDYREWQTILKRSQPAIWFNTYDSFVESKFWTDRVAACTLTQLNDAVTQVARSGNLEQANQVCNLLVQVKREVTSCLQSSKQEVVMSDVTTCGAVCHILSQAAEGLPKLRASKYWSPEEDWTVEERSAPSSGNSSHWTSDCKSKDSQSKRNSQICENLLAWIEATAKPVGLTPETRTNASKFARDIHSVFNFTTLYMDVDSQ